MRRKLASAASLEIHSSLDSTSLEAKRRAAAGEAGPVWIIALNQTAGYGRRGSEWRQQEGDIAATYLYRECEPPDRAPQLSFVAALSVGDAIQRFAPRAAISFKWPNDILLDGAKVAGLLLELLSAEREPVIAFGVGVNVVSAPAGLPYRTARLVDVIEAPPSPAEFVAVLDETYDIWADEWRKRGFACVREAWTARAYGMGAKAKVIAAAGEASGIIAGIGEDGALLLDTDAGRRSIAAGSLFIEQS